VASPSAKCWVHLVWLARAQVQVQVQALVPVELPQGQQLDSAGSPLLLQ
jgi:hypothetical protein